ncbi:ribonuclease HII [Alteribacillus bidgolensis]|uniref:Ribonuclease HII n=1 Tax=Alteribacillus bidgolensis TaxID=930129 RepID=A0A1G8GEL1_9BACI|nr:ribonuclease HII [Alteribacillus bidgolensis]SDH92776.1 RNase HII [Alteribacillus bidgolensis]
MEQKKKTISEIKQILACSNVEDKWLEKLRKDERKGVQQLIAQYEKKLAYNKKLEEEYATLLRNEKEWQALGYRYIAGVDEVGRGPLAGPVTAGAAILPDNALFPGLTDSKKLSEEKREYYYNLLKEQVIAYHVVHIPAEKIDSINIYQASKEAMKQAVAGLSIKADALFIDAMSLPLPLKQLSLTKGDAKSASIAAASVLAKVERDRYMKEKANSYPEYGFEKHMGYGTKHHLEALRTYGPTPEHRKSFSPVKACLS